MITMLKLHFYYSRKTLALIGIIIAFTIVILYYFFEGISLNLFSLIFLLQIALFGISFYMDNHFMRILRTMPIAAKDFVTSAYAFAFIIIAVIGLPIMLQQFYQVQGIATDSFMPYIFLGFLAVCVVHIGVQLKQYFTNPTQSRVRLDLANILILFVVLFSPHTLILIFFNAFFSIELGGFIIPILSLWIYYKLCQSAITKFKQAEL